jgi:NTP pyrophosphatase (non-canonical NTP hydrolase)
MELRELINLQRQFDLQHFTKFRWSAEISSENLQQLQYLMISLAGEVGELANCIKKVIRGDKEYDVSKAEINEELVDVFIYVLKLAYQMNVDLESNFLHKLEKNKLRFKPYEKND